MVYQIDKLEKLAALTAQHAPQEGGNFTKIENFGTYKASTTQVRAPALDLPAMFIVGQGRKCCYVGDKRYDYRAGNAIVMFFPMAVETEIIEASPEKPFLAAGVRIDLGRLADVLLRMDRVDGALTKSMSSEISGIVSLSLTDHLLDPMIRLFEALADPRDAAILGGMIIDEIYYRILRSEQGSDLRRLLQQTGQIQRISKAVEYIHKNLDKPVSVEKLADLVHMSKTSFYENFKEVLHVSPLQYAKSMKLFKAQTLIKEGLNVSEAGYQVGYNSPAQFSREYKRHFGFAPSSQG